MSSYDTFVPPAPRKKKNTKGLSLAAESLAPPNLDDDASLYDSAIASQLVPSRSLRLSNHDIGEDDHDDSERTKLGGGLSIGNGGISLTKLPLRAAPPNPDGTNGKRSMAKRGDTKGSFGNSNDYQTKMNEKLGGLDLSESEGGGGGETSPTNSVATIGENTDQPPPTAKASSSTTRRKAGASSTSLSSTGKKRRPSREGLTEFKHEDFSEIKDLGAGNGGTVNLVKHEPSGMVMAKKLVLIDAKPSVRKQILRELQIMHDCSSPWIVSFYGAFLSDPHICICMEYMDKGSLDGVYKQIGAIEIDVVGKVAEAVLEGLTYLYDVHRIIHRDIKPSNILLNSEGQIKICDFGVSGELVNSIANTFVGTSTYMSPERIQGSNYSVKSDVWSVGVSLVELALGRFPFSDNDEDDHSPGANDTISSAEGARRHAAQHENGNGYPKDSSSSGSNGVSLGGGGATMSILDLLQHIVNEPAPKLTPVGKFPKMAEDFIDGCLMKEPKERKSPKELLKSEWMIYIKSAPIDLKAWASKIR